MEHEDRVTGWWVFAGVVLGISGTMDIIWGIAAVSSFHRSRSSSGDLTSS